MFKIVYQFKILLLYVKIQMQIYEFLFIPLIFFAIQTDTCIAYKVQQTNHHNIELLSASQF